MKLVIMTRGRVDKQKTAQFIPPEWRHETSFLCPPEEVDVLYEKYRLGAVPFFKETPNYSNKFQYILDGGIFPSENKVVILDDDLRFCRRIEDGLANIPAGEAGWEDMSILFHEMEEHLDEVAQCGIQPRANGHVAPLPYKEIGKVIVANGVNRSRLREAGFMKDWRVDYAPILADTFLNCHLLSRGVPNRLITKFCVDWGASQAPGGCDYRTMRMQEEAIDILVEYFGPFVKKVVKRPKASKWLGDARIDFNVQWKKMFQTGQIRHKTGAAAQ